MRSARPVTARGGVSTGGAADGGGVRGSWRMTKIPERDGTVRGVISFKVVERENDPLSIRSVSD